ncbi:ribosomal protein L31 [secondary endosymbiont of Heteropsylla cubana]|uniref:Large ribosomal subunit protein bL31 n=1 Tax=secondary endosymbiont of Heteropsylla cubana TaxID=134287 RepID=J3TYY1_9ENTR|nr:50S ribosomal protein L31 [secondary endosymbiont of Heteropsylla cubana]AFP85645.1 ribosomal protein L31 [secondary endosymbiont of Heteropsylla cubana]
MKKNIHPIYKKILATCSCGNIIEIRSTIEHNLSLDVCSSCHPFYTGTQRVINTGGRIDRFNKRFKIPKEK